MNQSRRLIKFLSNYEPLSDDSTNVVQQQSLANYTESDVYTDFVRVYLPVDATTVYDEKSLLHSDARTTNRLDNLIPTTTTTTTSSSVISNTTNDSSVCHFLVDVSLYDKLMTIYNENEQINLQEIKHRLHEKIRRSSGDKITLGVTSAAAVAAVAAVSTIEDLENDLKNGANGSGANESAKTKTEVINTQTGIKYVAPMRGGHVSQIGRAIAAATAASQPMQASSSKSQF